MKKLTNILTEEECSQLSLVYLHGGIRKEIEFWFNYWQEHNFNDKSIFDLNSIFADMEMSFAAIYALRIIIRSKDKLTCPKFSSNKRNAKFINQSFTILEFLKYKEQEGSSQENINLTKENDVLYCLGENGETILDVGTPYTTQIRFVTGGFPTIYTFNI